MRNLLACVVVTTAVLAATADVAHACSCAPPEPRSLLAQADGAFVGLLEQRRDLGNGRALFTFRVERNVKGQIGPTVDVETASNGASCGIETTVGSRIGLFLDRVEGRWTSSLCWQVDADDLLAAVGPLPAPTGGGPVALLLGSRLGPVRTIALDAFGRTLAYGRGAGTVLRISACPGKRRVAEAVQLEDGATVAIREFPGLRLVHERRITSPPATLPSALHCESADGRRVAMFHSSADRPGGAWLERLTGARRAVLWRGTAIGATLTGQTAFVTAGRRGTRLLAVDLSTGRSRVLGRIPPPVGPLVMDPTGTHLAGIVSTEGSRRWLARLRLSPFRVVTAPLVEPGNEVAWLETGRVVLFPSGGRRARVYGPALRVASTFSWTAYQSVVTGSAAYGVAFDGLHRAPLPSGPERVVGRLPSPIVSVVVAVPR